MKLFMNIFYFIPYNKNNNNFKNNKKFELNKLYYTIKNFKME